MAIKIKGFKLTTSRGNTIEGDEIAFDSPEEFAKVAGVNAKTEGAPKVAPRLANVPTETVEPEASFDNGTLDLFDDKVARDGIMWTEIHHGNRVKHRIKNGIHEFFTRGHKRGNGAKVRGHWKKCEEATEATYERANTWHEEFEKRANLSKAQQNHWKNLPPTRKDARTAHLRSNGGGK